MTWINWILIAYNIISTVCIGVLTSHVLHLRQSVDYKIEFYKRRAEEKEHEANNLRLRINQTLNKPYL